MSEIAVRIRKMLFSQFCSNLLCQDLLPNFSHGSGECGPADWLLPSSLQPLLNNGLIYAVSIAPMLGFDGNNSCSGSVIEEEGPQHGVASAEKSENVNGLGLCWKADEKRKSGHRICTGKRKYSVLAVIYLVTWGGGGGGGWHERQIQHEAESIVLY